MRLSRIRFVAAYQLDEQVLLSLGSGLKTFQGELQSHVEFLNTPESASPEAPRAFMRIDDSLINICLNRLDVTVFIPDHIEDFESILEYGRDRMVQIYSAFPFEAVVHDWSGVICPFEHPLDSSGKRAGEMVSPLFDLLVNLKRGRKKLSSFQLQYGFENQGLFETFTVSGYETLQGKFKGPPQNQRFLRVQNQDLDVVESGVQIVIDINDRPSRPHKEPVNDLKKIIARVPQLHGEIVETIKKGGVSL